MSICRERTSRGPASESYGMTVVRYFMESRDNDLEAEDGRIEESDDDEAETDLIFFRSKELSLF